MPEHKAFSEFDEATVVADADLLLITDVSDLTDSPAGSTRRVQASGIFRDAADVRRYGAALDNSTNDAAAFTAAHAATGRVCVPRGFTARVAGTLTFSSSIHMYGGGTIRPDILAGNLFAFETDDVLVEDLTFDGTGSTGTLTNNLRVLFGGDGATQFRRHVYRGLYFDDLDLSDGLTESSNLLVTHGIYVDQVDGVSIYDCHFNTLSGAGVFVRDIDGLRVTHCSFTDCQWYNVNLDSGITNFVVNYNKFDCQLATGVFYGGMINCMSLQTGTRNQDGDISHNYFTGNVSYGTVIRVLSTTNCRIAYNRCEAWAAGTWAIDNALSFIRVDTRGISTSEENGPCHDIDIIGNVCDEAPTNTEEHRGIYVGNLYQTTRVPATRIRVLGNRITSTDTNDYFSEGIIFHGQDGGIDNVVVEDNDVTVYGQTTPVVGGAIGFVGNDSDGGVRNIWVGKNKLVGLGTPSGSQELGISIGAYTQDIHNTHRNRIDNFYYGVRTFTNSSDIYDFDDQDFANIAGGGADLLEGVALARYAVQLTGSTTWNPGSIGDGDEQTQVVNVTGAALGDFVIPSFSLDVSDLQLTADVTVAGQITAVLSNSTNGAIDLAEGTLRVRVIRAGNGE